MKETPRYTKQETYQSERDSKEKETSERKWLIRDSKERETLFEVSFSSESLSLKRDSKERKWLIRECKERETYERETPSERDSSTHLLCNTSLLQKRRILKETPLHTSTVIRLFCKRDVFWKRLLYTPRRDATKWRMKETFIYSERDQQGGLSFISLSLFAVSYKSFSEDIKERDQQSYQVIGLFCRISFFLLVSFAKET